MKCHFHLVTCYPSMDSALRADSRKLKPLQSLTQMTMDTPPLGTGRHELPEMELRTLVQNLSPTTAQVVAVIRSGSQIYDGMKPDRHRLALHGWMQNPCASIHISTSSSMSLTMNGIQFLVMYQENCVSCASSAYVPYENNGSFLSIVPVQYTGTTMNGGE